MRQINAMLQFCGRDESRPLLRPFKRIASVDKLWIGWAKSVDRRWIAAAEPHLYAFQMHLQAIPPIPASAAPKSWHFLDQFDIFRNFQKSYCNRTLCLLQ